jgi:hypothetical protein
MKGEIDKDYFCSRYTGEIACMERLVSFENCPTCECYHRKYPTPEQYREEYGENYPDDGAVFFRVTKEPYNVEFGDWHLGEYKDAITDIGDGYGQIVCACTPWGNPPADWRPE